MTYSEFIDDIISSRGQWNIPEGEMWEGHHIIPKCMGGEGKYRSKDKNIIWLYPKEHYIAHKLLYEEHPNNKGLAFAWFQVSHMRVQDAYIELTEEEYESAREAYSFAQKGHEVSEETRRKISKSRMGIKFTEEHREALRKPKSENGKNNIKKAHNPNQKNALGYKWTEEQREKLSNSTKGRIPWNKGLKGEENPQYGKRKPKGFGEKISNAKKGKPSKLKGTKHSKEWSANISKSKIGKKLYTNGEIKRFFSPLEDEIPIGFHLVKP